MITVNDLDSISYHPLVEAAAVGDLRQLRRLLEQGCNPNMVDAMGSSPLHFAAQEGHLGAVRMLLTYGADPDLINNEFSPLRSTPWRFRLSVARALMDHGARKGLIDLFVLLFMDNKSAAVRSIVREYNIDINEPGEDGPLINQMVALHDSSSVRLLLSLGAKLNPHLVDKDFRMNIFGLAASSPSPKLLVTLWNVWSESLSTHPVRRHKARDLSASVPKKLRQVIDKRADLRWGPAHAAAWLSDQSFMRSTTRLQPKSVHMMDRFGFTPLFVAIARNNLPCVRQLIRAGADVNYQNRHANSVSPLYVATGFGFLRIVRELLDAGANPNARALKNRTVSVHATIRHRFAVMKLLAQHGAKPDLNYIVEDKGYSLRQHLRYLRREDIIKYIDQL